LISERFHWSHPRDQHGNPVADAVVVAVPADRAPRPPARSREEAIHQVDKEFLPKVQIVLVGAPVTFPNNDDVRHHVLFILRGQAL